QGAAHNLSLAVSPDGSAVVAFAGGGDGIWAASGTVTGGVSAPGHVAARDYSKDSAPKVAARDARDTAPGGCAATHHRRAHRAAGRDRGRPGGAPLPAFKRGAHRGRGGRERDRGFGVVLVLAPGRRQGGAGRVPAGGIMGGARGRRSRRYLRVRRQQRQR